MTYIEADVLQPIQIVVPTQTPITGHAKKGSLIMSGAKLYVYSGTAYELVTSTAV